MEDVWGAGRGRVWGYASQRILVLFTNENVIKVLRAHSSDFDGFADGLDNCFTLLLQILTFTLVPFS